MHSIRTRITSLTVGAILMCACLIGAVSIITVRSEENRISEQLINLICDAKCDEMNEYLSKVEESANTISRFAYDSLDLVALSNADVIGATGSGRSLSKRNRTVQQQEELDAYLHKHLEAVETVFDTIASGEASVMSYYYRINPEISKNESGFWYSRHNTVNFTKHVVTPIEEYRLDDMSHVGWFYLTLDRGYPSWIGPYENKNMGMTVVTYSVPLFKAGTFIGVVGIDVSYATIVDRISGLEVLDTGYAFLTDEKGKIVYHPTLQNGLLLSDISTELGEGEYLENRSRLISYTFNGEKKKASWSTLTNGLRLIVSVPAREVNAGWRKLSWFIVLTVLLTSGVFVALITARMKRITDPLERLAQASKQLSAGNYDVKLTYEGDDEIGTLTRSFTQMAERMQFFISDLNAKAYKDALTHVRNKQSFNLATLEMDEAIQASTPSSRPKFAVVMFDCNNLKVINDTYGHEKGDVYLQTACGLICRVLDHSPVFRIGGDEFAAILQNEDLRNWRQLNLRFDIETAHINSTARFEWERVSLARGMAAYDPTLDPDMASVLRRADDAMYENKKRMKAAMK